MEVDKTAQGLMAGSDMIGQDAKLLLDKVDLKLMSGKDHRQVLMSYHDEIPLKLDLQVVPGKSDLCFVAAFDRLG